MQQCHNYLWIGDVTGFVTSPFLVVGMLPRFNVLPSPVVEGSKTSLRGRRIVARKPPGAVCVRFSFSCLSRIPAVIIRRVVRTAHASRSSARRYKRSSVWEFVSEGDGIFFRFAFSALLICFRANSRRELMHRASISVRLIYDADWGRRNIFFCEEGCPERSADNTTVTLFAAALRIFPQTCEA